MTSAARPIASLFEFSVFLIVLTITVLVFGSFRIYI
jgi:hypothetical protein